MKIIKEGIIPLENQFTCPTCGCIFEYEPTDVTRITEKVEEFSAFGFGAGTDCKKYDVATIHCPCCKKYLEIGRKLIFSEWLPYAIKNI